MYIVGYLDMGYSLTVLIRSLLLVTYPRKPSEKNKQTQKKIPLPQQSF